MKRHLYKLILFTSLISLLVDSICFAQQPDLSKYRFRFNFKTVKQSDNSRLLEVNFIASNKEDRKDLLPIYGATINFYNVINSDSINLGKSLTSKAGIAQLVLPENQKYKTDSEGNINLLAVFKGNEKIDAQEEELKVKDLHLYLILKDKDTLRTVTLNAYTVDSLGVKNPVNDVDVSFYLKGMLSKKNLEDVTLVDGTYEFDFTQKFSGNTKGNLIIGVKIEDNDDFGNVFKEESAHWGTFNKTITHDENMLWTKAAPIWMYVVLSILLIGVWANYVYTIINLFKLKKEGSAIGIVQPE